MNKINIFIPAAGLGERLRPITHYIPKPLIPVLGRPVIQYVLDKVSALSFEKIAINIHHKKEAIEDWLSRCSLKDKITIIKEETILGTGGALKNAESVLKERTFLVHNSDVLSDINLDKLIKYHVSSRNLVTLAVHDCPEFNSLVIDENGSLCGLSREQLSDDVQKLAFTGIAVYEPEFLRFLPDGASSVVDAWLDAIHAGEKIRTFNTGGSKWSDIGTPGSYAYAVFDALRAEGENIHVDRGHKQCRNMDLHGHVVIEKDCMVAEGVVLRNCILLPGSNISGAVHELPLQIENCIIGPAFKIDLNEAEILIFDEGGKQLIGTGGSDRKYYRLRDGNKTRVLMKCKEDDRDFERHLEYTRFFLGQSVPVPAIVTVMPESRQAVFEDAGDMSLYSYLKCPREDKDIESVYKKVLDALSLIHAKASRHLSECPLLNNIIFDRDYFRWETAYFIERLVYGIKKIEIDNSSPVEQELNELASKADSFPKTIVHRDFQSQNIMIMQGMDIKILDFQGARIGPSSYDVASILWDPYFRLGNDIRDRLVDYYIMRMKDSYSENFDEISFSGSLLICRMQRHMQALGAYGFLSSVKGKKHFLKYVPEGLRLLKEDIYPAREEYPELFKLIMKL